MNMSQIRTNESLKSQLITLIMTTIQAQ